MKNVHFSKGTLLDYDGIYLSEGGWPQQAYQDAARRESLRGKSRPLNYSSAKAPRVSHGPYNQDVEKPIEFVDPVNSESETEAGKGESSPEEAKPAEVSTEASKTEQSATVQLTEFETELQKITPSGTEAPTAVGSEQ